MTTPYRPPLRDIAFAFEVLDAPDSESSGELLAPFGEFCAEEVAPLNAIGDSQGVAFDPGTGAVTTAPGWKRAYRRYVDAGWNSVSFDPVYGGGGLSTLLNTAMQEQLNAASMAFALCPMLTQSAVHLIEHHGTADQKARLLPKLISGDWAGAMSLSEQAAGSDLGAISSLAEPLADGSWRVNGQKIFTTYGEHDLTEQIVHMVLARTPGAPPGTRGISCFVVPRLLADGRRNGVRCVGVESKMGIHASPTCTLLYEDAVAEIVGRPGDGLRNMFTMMNRARLSVGVEGLGVASRAQQAASVYAKERVQGRVEGSSEPTIAGHADVRRMLVTMRASVEAMRLLVYRNAMAIDAGDEAMADLLTPITKAWCTDTGAKVARLATQVFGGLGYIREAGVEQNERDLRIAAIYEGTNGIQALDLVGRKLVRDGGATLHRLLAELEGMSAEIDDHCSERLDEGFSALRYAADHLNMTWKENPRDALAGATPFLSLAGTVIAAGLLARQLQLSAKDDDPFRLAKADTARFFIGQLLPCSVGLLPSITAGAMSMDAIPTELL